MSLNAIGCKMLLSSSQELHSRTYIAEWPSQCPQQTLDTDAPLRSGVRLLPPWSHLCHGQARCHLCPALCSRMLGEMRAGRDWQVTTVWRPCPPVWSVGAMTLTGPDCQVSAILPGSARLRGQARHNWPAPTLRLWLRHSVQCTLTVQWLYTPCSLSGSALTDCSQYYHLAPYITDPET